jgi:hypothetical protein
MVPDEINGILNDSLNWKYPDFHVRLQFSTLYTKLFLSE